MTNEIRPRIGQGGIPRCAYDACPQYDGKRCRAMGFKPDGICEPAVLDLVKRAAKPPGVDAQPRPTTGDVEVWPLVLKDIEARRKFGDAKYGVPLRTNDGRKSLVDAYQEALDFVVYLRKEIEERKQ